MPAMHLLQTRLRLNNDALGMGHTCCAWRRPFPPSTLPTPAIDIVRVSPRYTSSLPWFYRHHLPAARRRGSSPRHPQSARLLMNTVIRSSARHCQKLLRPCAQSFWYVGAVQRRSVLISNPGRPSFTLPPLTYGQSQVPLQLDFAVILDLPALCNSTRIVTARYHAALPCDGTAERRPHPARVLFISRCVPHRCCSPLPFTLLCSPPRTTCTYEPKDLHASEHCCKDMSSGDHVTAAGGACKKDVGRLGTHLQCSWSVASIGA